MDTILYLYAKRNTRENEQKTKDRQAKTQPDRKKHFFRLRKYSLGKFLGDKFYRENHSKGRQEMIQLKRTEYQFPDYRLVKISVMETDNCAEDSLRTQLYELTEDPDHTYVACREPLSFYYGREFREYGQQEWVEHLLR